MKGVKMHRAVQMLKNDPNLTAMQIAVQLGITRQAVYEALRKAGMKAASRPHPRRESKFRQTDRRKQENGWPAQGARMSNGLHLTRSTRGELSELIICTDLISKGANVFRSVTQCAPFDLVAYVKGVAYRVEVRTARRRADGTVGYASPTDREYDVLALYVPEDATIIYRGLPGFDGG